jgi:hypothetical protein
MMFAEHRAMMSSQEINALQQAKTGDPAAGRPIATKQSCEDEFLERPLPQPQRGASWQHECSNSVMLHESKETIGHTGEIEVALGRSAGVGRKSDAIRLDAPCDFCHPRRDCHRCVFGEHD